MRILITGGAGFIGSHLTGLLSSETVTILDDLSAGRLENIPDDANFVCCDVKSPLARDVVKNGHFDAIVHLAAQTMVPASMEDPKKDMEDNIEGTVNILEAARKYGVKRIIFSSSAAVYGDIAPECLPVRETEPLRPVSFYGLSKMTCENYIRLYQKAYGLSYVIFRFANVYGERQGNGGEGGVVSVFARQLAEGKSPAIYGNGQQTRDFIYAGDIANGIRKALFSETANITCNLSTGREVTVKDAADRLLRLFAIIPDHYGDDIIVFPDTGCKFCGLCILHGIGQADLHRRINKLRHISVWYLSGDPNRYTTAFCCMVQAVLRRLQNRITERNAFLPFTEHYFRRDTIQIPGKKLLRHGNAGGKAVMHGRFCCKCFFLPCNCFHRFGKLLQLFCILRQFMIINGKLCQRLMH